MGKKKSVKKRRIKTVWPKGTGARSTYSPRQPRVEGALFYGKKK